MKDNIGKLGENFAEEYLKRRGYEIISRNYHSRYGEIDIIARDNEYIVFVEVKTRKSGSIVRGIESVDFKKQRKIIKTAVCYLKDIGQDVKMRFDVAEVEYFDIKRMYIKNYIENAFTLEGFGEIF